MNISAFLLQKVLQLIYSDFVLPCKSPWASHYFPTRNSLNVFSHQAKLWVRLGQIDVHEVVFSRSSHNNKHILAQHKRLYDARSFRVHALFLFCSKEVNTVPAVGTVERNDMQCNQLQTAPEHMITRPWRRRACCVSIQSTSRLDSVTLQPSLGLSVRRKDALISFLASVTK